MKKDDLSEDTLLISGRAWIWIQVENIRLMNTGIFFCLSCVLWKLQHLEQCLAQINICKTCVLGFLFLDFLSIFWPSFLLWPMAGALHSLFLLACPMAAPPSSLEFQLQKIPCFLNSIFSFSPFTPLSYSFTSAIPGNLHLELGFSSIIQDFPAHRNTSKWVYFF